MQINSNICGLFHNKISVSLVLFCAVMLYIVPVLQDWQYVCCVQDLFALDLEPYRYSGVNMTGFRLLNIDSPQVASVVERWAMERLQAPSKPETGMMEGMMTVSLSILQLTLYFWKTLQYIFLLPNCAYNPRNLWEEHCSSCSTHFGCFQMPDSFILSLL